MHCGDTKISCDCPTFKPADSYRSAMCFEAYKELSDMQIISNYSKQATQWLFSWRNNKQQKKASGTVQFFRILWSQGASRSIGARSSRKDGQGIKSNAGERFFCTIRIADFMPFPAKPRLVCTEIKGARECDILKQEQNLNIKCFCTSIPFLIKIMVVF